MSGACNGYHVREFARNTNVMQYADPIRRVKTLADRLKFARTSANLTQQELADLAKVSQGTIANVEAGIRQTARRIVHIAVALNVEPNWLDRGEGPMQIGVKETAPRYEVAALQVPIDIALRTLMTFLSELDGLDRRMASDAIRYLLDDPSDRQRLAEAQHFLKQAPTNKSDGQKLSAQAKKKSWHSFDRRN